MVLKSLLKMTLSPQENYLIKHQKQVVLDSESPSNSDDFKFNPNDESLLLSTYAMRLAQGVV